MALAAAGLAPVFLGLNMVFSPAGSSATIARTLSDARLDPSDEHRLGVIYTGLYVLTLGLLLLGAAWDPRGQGELIRVAGLLFVMRGLQRYFRAHELESAYGVSNGKNWMHVSWLSGIGLFLILFAGYAPRVNLPDFKVVYAVRQIVLGLITLQGVVIGAILAVYPRFALELCALLTNARKLPSSPQFMYIVQPLGVYMIAFGLLAGCAQRPGSIPRLDVALGVLLIARGAARWVTGDMLRFCFGVTRPVLTAQGVALILAGVIVIVGPRLP